MRDHALRMGQQSEGPEVPASVTRRRIGAESETRTVTEADLQVLLASPELRVHFSRARLGSAHYLVVQSQTAFLKAL